MNVVYRAYEKALSLALLNPITVAAIQRVTDCVFGTLPLPPEHTTREARS